MIQSCCFAVTLADPCNVYVSCVPRCDIQEVPPPPRGRPKFPGGPARNIPGGRWGEGGRGS